MKKQLWKILLEEAKKRDAMRNNLLDMGTHDYVGPCSKDGSFLVRDSKLGPKGPYNAWYRVNENDERMSELVAK